MEFINRTSFPSLVHRTAIGDDLIAMSVMCRLTYDVNKGEATISENQEWELYQDFWESDYGPMDKDDVYCRGGVDIMVFGSAKAPKGSAVTHSEVVISLNNKELHKVKVYGERVWNSFLGVLSKSSPEPFEEIELSLHNAFGGVSNWDGIEIPYPSNPYGKGYYPNKEAAIGNPLPNIEHADNLISKWKEWQEPSGVASLPIMPLKAKQNLILNEEKTGIERLDDKFFNSAFPELIVDEIKAGDIIRVDGVTGGEAFNITVPKTTLEIDILLGETKVNRKMTIDQVGVVPDKNQVFISYRFPFRYIVKPQEKRETILSLIN